MELSSICAVSATDMRVGAPSWFHSQSSSCWPARFGLRFSVYVLVFAIYFGTAVLAGVGAVVQIETWQIALDIAVVGYFAGGALMSGTAPSGCCRPNSSLQNSRNPARSGAL
jgi:hypothetical protein